MSNVEQENKVIELIQKKKSFLLTGCAGTGKSYMTDLIVAKLSTYHQSESIGVTAMTGIAALNIGGVTLHSYLGIGVEKESSIILSKIEKYHYEAKWKQCSVLIIDEVSMLGGHLFEELEIVARTIRKSEIFFGGIEIILVGDFFQLPPVEKEEIFLFESEVFKQNIKDIVNLDFNYRQNDVQFLKILNDIRLGILTRESELILRSRCSSLPSRDGILPTHLYSLVKSVQDHNEVELRKLKNRLFIYNARDSCDSRVLGVKDKWLIEQINKSTRIPKVLKLKVGAQIMYLKNKSEFGLCNGTKGVVVGFKECFPIVKFENGKTLSVREFKHTITLRKKKKPTILMREQLPICHAWAVTIHKEQGLTLSKVVISTKRIFAPGQVYVALSRVRDLKGLQLLDFNKKVIKTNRKILEFYATFDSEVRNVFKKRKSEIQFQKKRKKRKIT